jgi:hypothetical protein
LDAGACYRLQKKYKTERFQWIEYEL